MRIGPLTIDWSTAEWALFLSILSLGGSGVTFFLAELRRWERVSIRVNLGYRVKLDRDRYLFPTVVEHQNPREGERCCLLTIKYRGQHSLTLKAAFFEIAGFRLFPFNPRLAACVLYDGQSKRALLAARMFDLADVTGFAIETESHGVRFKPVRRFLRFQLRNVVARPRLFSVLRAVTGVPRDRASEIEPRRCPNCGARRRHITIVSDELVQVPTTDIYKRSRHFRCGRCEHAWSALGQSEKSPAAQAKPPGPQTD